MEEEECKTDFNEWSLDQHKLTSCILCNTAFNQSDFCPITLKCGHTLCKGCLKSTADCKTCPKDETTINKDLVLDFPINSALLFLCDLSPVPLGEKTKKLIGYDNLQYFDKINKCLEEIVVLLKSSTSGMLNRTVKGSVLSRSILNLLNDLINSQLIENEGRQRLLKTSNFLVQCIATELILRYQNPQQLASSLWAAIRTRGCQFLGPVMQTKVLHLILDALKDSCALSRKVLVLNVVEKLENQFAQTSKTAVGHVVQLLYRASCFKVTKREDESSLMQLKSEFLTYDSLRREHDTQILQIALEAGIRFTAEQWSQLLYADSSHKQTIQSIMDDMPDYYMIQNSLQELTAALQKCGDPANLTNLMPHLEFLYNIDLNLCNQVSWSYLNEVMSSLKLCLFSMIDFIHHHTTHKSDSLLGAYAIGKYKTSLCRDVIHRGVCPRGKACTFAHSEQEMERYRQRARKSAIRHQELVSEGQKSASRNTTVSASDVNSFAGLNWGSVPSTLPLSSSFSRPPDDAAAAGPLLSTASTSSPRFDDPNLAIPRSDIPALRVAAQGVLNELRSRKEEVIAELRKSHVATSLINQKLHYSGNDHALRGHSSLWTGFSSNKNSSNSSGCLTKSIDALPKIMLSSKPSSYYPHPSVPVHNNSHQSYPMSEDLIGNIETVNQTFPSLPHSLNDDETQGCLSQNGGSPFSLSAGSLEYDSKFYWPGEPTATNSKYDSVIDTVLYKSDQYLPPEMSKNQSFPNWSSNNQMMNQPLTSYSSYLNAPVNSVSWSHIAPLSLSCGNINLENNFYSDFVEGNQPSDDVRSFWTSVRQDEEVPFSNEPTVSKFGPISRKSKQLESAHNNYSVSEASNNEISQSMYEKQVNLTAHLIEINAQITAIAQNVRLREELDSLVSLERDLQHHAQISSPN